MLASYNMNLHGGDWWCYSWIDLHISYLLYGVDLSCCIKMEVWVSQISCCMKLTMLHLCHSLCGHSCLLQITTHALPSCFVTRWYLSFHCSCNLSSVPNCIWWYCRIIYTCLMLLKLLNQSSLASDEIPVWCNFLLFCMDYMETV